MYYQLHFITINYLILVIQFLILFPRLQDFYLNSAISNNFYLKILSFIMEFSFNLIILFTNSIHFTIIIIIMLIIIKLILNHLINLFHVFIN